MQLKELRLLKSLMMVFLCWRRPKIKRFWWFDCYQQSGIKNFRFADPIIHQDLFKLAENYIKKIDDINEIKFKFLLKLFDKAEIINVKEY